jgi:PEGA domain-containing protein
MRLILILATVFFLNGCFVTSGGMRSFTSTPSGATVTIDGYGACETPCTVKLDGYRKVTVAKAGYKAQRFGVKPGGAPVNVILELAAPAGVVDSETLPDL